MLGDPLDILRDHPDSLVTPGGDNTISYSLTRFDSTGTVRTRVGMRLEAANPTSVASVAPDKLIISHSTVGKGAQLRNRHLVRFETESEAADGTRGTGSPLVGYFVFDVPKNNINPNAIYEMFRVMSGFFRGNPGDDPHWSKLERVLGDNES